MYNMFKIFTASSIFCNIYCTFLTDVKFKILLLWSITRECNIFTFYNVHWKNIETDMFRFELTILWLNKAALRIVFPRCSYFQSWKYLFFYKLDLIPRVFSMWHFMIEKRKIVNNFCSKSFIENIAIVQ